MSRCVRNLLLCMMLTIGVGTLAADEIDPLSVVCTDPEMSHELSRTADPQFFRGRLSLIDDQLEFRSCDTENIYILDTSFENEEKLRDFFATLSGGETKPAFVRFTGYKLECDGPLPPGLTGIIKVRQLQAYTSTIPGNCN